MKHILMGSCLLLAAPFMHGCNSQEPVGVCQEHPEYGLTQEAFASDYEYERSEEIGSYSGNRIFVDWFVRRSDEGIRDQALRLLHVHEGALCKRVEFVLISSTQSVSFHNYDDCGILSFFTSRQMSRFGEVEAVLVKLEPTGKNEAFSMPVSFLDERGSNAVLFARLPMTSNPLCFIEMKVSGDGSLSLDGNTEPIPSR